MNHELFYKGAEKAVAVIAAGNRDLAWGTMVYACDGQRDGSCSHEERYWLCVGVEGPDDLRAQVNTAAETITAAGWTPEFQAQAQRAIDSIGGMSVIPSPFVAGRCPLCARAMSHVRWSDDESFPDFRPVPEGARYFRVPEPAKASEFARQNYGGAELVQ